MAIEQTKKLDKLIWIAIIGLTMVAIFLNYHYSSQPFWMRLGGWLIWAICSASLAWFTQKGQDFVAFAQTAYDELLRVVWPTRQETIQTTIIVVIMVTVSSLFLWGLDAVLLWLVGLLTGQRG